MTDKKYDSSKRMLMLDGIYPPLPTPFDEKGKISAKAMMNNISFLLQFELRGFVVLGSNGEYVMLDTDEKIAVMEMAREAVPPENLLIAGTGCQSTAETLALTNKAAEIGIDAALIITPSYYKNLMTQEVMINHYHTLADNSHIPILIYNMPAGTGIDLEAETIALIARHPNVIGIKDSSGNIGKMAAIRHLTGSGFQILAGSGGFLLPAMAVGAIGGIMALANIAPHVCIAIRRLYMEGRQIEARELQLRMISLNTAVTSLWGVPALKAAMDIQGLYGGPVRLPLLSVSEDIKKQINAILMTTGVKF